MTNDSKFLNDKYLKYVGLLLNENELINQRLTWLISSQSILFAGYAVLLSTDIEKIKSKDKWDAALAWIPNLGMFVSFLILIGSIAAIIASVILTREYNKDKAKDNKLLGVHPVTTIAGWIPPLLLPIAFIFVWNKISPIAFIFVWNKIS